MMVRKIQRVRMGNDFVTRLVGLMGRREWPKALNGLFFPNCASVHTFFTFLSLDIVFLDKGQKILKIFPSTRTWRVYWGPRHTAHCLELPAGAARKSKLKVGDPIRF